MPRESIPIEVNYVASKIFSRSKCNLNGLQVIMQVSLYICAIPCSYAYVGYTMTWSSLMMKLSSIMQHSRFMGMAVNLVYYYP